MYADRRSFFRHMVSLIALSHAPLIITAAEWEPQRLASTLLTNEPYRYNGMIRVSSSTGSLLGSGSMIGHNIMATAAHVVYDDDAKAWIDTSSVTYYPQHGTSGSPMLRPGLIPVSRVRFDSYATRSAQEEPGLSSPDTFNLDFILFVFFSGTPSASLSAFPEVAIQEGERLDSINLLRHNRRDKMLVGYPQDDEAIPLNDQGFMHATEAGDYYAEWDGIEDVDGSWRDSEDFWKATYSLPDVAAYSGNSGGPVYVRTDQNNWAFAGVLVGGGTGAGAFVRAMEERALALMQTAVLDSQSEALLRVENLSATLDAGSVTLNWTDSSMAESGYRVYRLESGIWEHIATLTASSTEFSDGTVMAGRVYQYQVQAFADNGNLAPRSNTVAVELPGADSEAAFTLGTPELRYYHSGAASWFTKPGADGEPEALRAGVIHAMNQSAISLDLIGPGLLFFEWSASSEVNPDFGNNVPWGNDIYDALYVSLNGARVMSGNIPKNLSGIISNRTDLLTLSEGPQRITWSYEKDPYSSEGADTGYLHGVTWARHVTDGYPVYGAFDAGDGRHAATWFGDYDATLLPWIRHPALGWLYLFKTGERGMYAVSPDPQLGAFYTDPEFYPYLYRPGDDSWIYASDAAADGSNGAWFYNYSQRRSFSLGTD